MSVHVWSFTAHCVGVGLGGAAQRDGAVAVGWTVFGGKLQEQNVDATLYAQAESVASNLHLKSAKNVRPTTSELTAASHYYCSKLISWWLWSQYFWCSRAWLS